MGIPRVSPQEISNKYKHQSLGMPKASPSSSIKISGFFQTLHFYCFMHSCVVLGASLFLFLVLVLLVCLNKLVVPPHPCISFQINWFGLEKSRKSSCLSGKRSLFLTVAYALSCHAWYCFGLMLSYFCCSMTCFKQLRLLTVPWKNHALF